MLALLRPVWHAAEARPSRIRAPMKGFTLHYSTPPIATITKAREAKRRNSKATESPASHSRANDHLRHRITEREPWQVQKAALGEKFKEGWNPRKKLSPDALAGIRAIHAQFPEQYTTSVLAEKFEVSPEAIRRILKSRWTPKDDEVIDRQRRWFVRGQKVWSRYSELGLKPPARWRKLGIGKKNNLGAGRREWKSMNTNITTRSTDHTIRESDVRLPVTTATVRSDFPPGRRGGPPGNVESNTATEAKEAHGWNMPSTPSNSRTFGANMGLGLKLTPSNSPYSKTPRSPQKPRNPFELSLRRIIGTTVCSPVGFDCLSSSKIFAYVAGASAVVIHLDDNVEPSQRFFRARPTATPSIAVNDHSAAPSTPKNTANDSRNRSVASLRDAVTGYSPATPHALQYDWSDSSSTKTWTSRERIKAATCLSISKDGRFLAVGETGYLPRVLIFNLQESSDCPLVILNEHTFGVSAVAFSPDNRYLASIGTPNDGFLYVWSINPRTGAARLHSSNKCTSLIRSMVWMGNSIITVGTRHVKVWRVDSGQSSSPSKQRFSPEGIPIPSTAQSTAIKTLAGRNCLLGVLVETTFSCVTSISEDVAIVCSEKGDVCLLDDNDGQKLIKVGHVGFAVTCISANIARRLVCIGGRGRMKTIGFEELLKGNFLVESPDTNSSLSSSQLGSGTLYALASTTEICIAVNSEHAILVSKNNLVSQGSTPLTAHRDPVLGVRALGRPNSMAADFFTWSSTGEVLFWDLQGARTGSMQIEIEQSPIAEDGSPNQCQIIRASPSAAVFVSGDKYGVLRILEGTAHDCTMNTKAHSSDIQDIAIHEGESSILVASCGRDRTVQLFRKLSEWTLLQTMDEHTAACCSLFFCDGGNTLVSASADRTIQIRQFASREINGQETVAMIPTRVITLKASPVSMTLSSSDRVSNFVVSMLDRTIATYDIASGKLINSFRATDNEGNDAVVMDALVMGGPSYISGRPTILAGVSSTDKSVRIYDGITGAFVDREWGHTSAVTDLALLESTDLDKTTLISTGADSTIMIWEVSPRSPCLPDASEASSDARDESPTKEATCTRPPLRRVLSKVELAEFQRPSLVSTPTGRGSPPRSLRRKPSKYSVSTQSPKPTIPPVPGVPTTFPASNSQDLESRKGSSRARSRSPPASPRSRVSRRPSLASLEFRGRTKSASNFSEFGTLNMATEQVCRTLRAYQKKLSTNDLIRENLLQELDQELRLTAKAIGEKTFKTKAMSETVLAGLLDQYSERLVSIFDEKLRLSLSTNILDASTAFNSTASPSVIGSDAGRLE